METINFLQCFYHPDRFYISARFRRLTARWPHAGCSVAPGQQELLGFGAGLRQFPHFLCTAATASDGCIEKVSDVHRPRCQWQKQLDYKVFSVTAVEPR